MHLSYANFVSADHLFGWWGSFLDQFNGCQFDIRFWSWLNSLLVTCFPGLWVVFIFYGEFDPGSG